MEKVDWIIAGVGAVALVATLVGVIAYEDLSGDPAITFATAQNDLGTLDDDVDSPASFLFEVGDNATAASFDVTITFSGQAVQGGNADVTIEVTGPDGTETCTEALAIDGQATSASATYTCTLDAFWDVPEDTTESKAPAAKVWDDNYVVRISVTAPADTAVPFVGAGASYSFDASVTGTETYYAAVPDLPDIETA